MRPASLCGSAANRERRSAARGAGHLGQDHAGDVERPVETLGEPHRLLPSHGIGNEQDLLRRELAREAAELTHQRRVDLEPSRRIHYQHRPPHPARLLDGGVRGRDRIAPELPGVHRYADARA